MVCLLSSAFLSCLSPVLTLIVSLMYRDNCSCRKYNAKLQSVTKNILFLNYMTVSFLNAIPTIDTCDGKRLQFHGSLHTSNPVNFWVCVLTDCSKSEVVFEDTLLRYDSEKWATFLHFKDRSIPGNFSP